MAEFSKSIDTSGSKTLFEQAQKTIPGGVNSPVRAFKSVGGNPLFIEYAEGAWMYDVDGNRYLDLIGSWGPMILGHGRSEIIHAATQALQHSSSFGAPSKPEVDMAEKIVSMVPSVEKVRMVNSGTEATMSAIRLARGYTGRDKIIKFAGCYHGHGDSFLIAAGSGAMTFGVPDSQGVTKGTAQDTLTADFNDLDGVKELVAANPEAIAAIILEPVAGNMGCIPPAEGFLSGLRELCNQEGIVLIFDEVMTGFRLARGGAQELFGVMPDITTLGKIIGGGLPVGAYGGKAEIMDYISPAGPIYQAGTLSGNPVAMGAGLAMLNLLGSDPYLYGNLDHNGTKLAQKLRQIFAGFDFPHYISQLGSMLTIFFTEGPVGDLNSAKKSDTERFGTFFRHMLKRGIYLPPSQFEAWFLSSLIRDNEINLICEAAEYSLREMSS